MEVREAHPSLFIGPLKEALPEVPAPGNTPTPPFHASELEAKMH